MTAAKGTTVGETSHSTTCDQQSNLPLPRYKGRGTQNPLPNTSAPSFLKASATTRKKNQRNPKTAHGVPLKDLNRLARNVNHLASTSAGDHEVHDHTIDFHLQMMDSVTTQDTLHLLCITMKLLRLTITDTYKPTLELTVNLRCRRMQASRAFSSEIYIPL